MKSSERLQNWNCAELALWKINEFGDKFWFRTTRSRVQARWAKTSFGAVLWTLTHINLTELDKVGIVKSKDSIPLLQVRRYKLFLSSHIEQTQVQPGLYKIQRAHTFDNILQCQSSNVCTVCILYNPCFTWVRTIYKLKNSSLYLPICKSDKDTLLFTVPTLSSAIRFICLWVFKEQPHH